MEVTSLGEFMKKDFSGGQMSVDVELIEELGECEVPFGKYRGDSLASVYSMDPGYIRFIASKEGLNSVIFKIYLNARGEDV